MFADWSSEAGEALRFGGYKGACTRVEPGVPAAGYVETTWGTHNQVGGWVSAMDHMATLAMTMTCHKARHRLGM